MIRRLCLSCATPFDTHASWIRKGGGVYCSRSCAAATRTAARNGNWKGGRSVRRDGRILVIANDRSDGAIHGHTTRYVLEYRLVAERKLGRPLQQNEIVHHLNGNTADNRPENLEITTQSRHAAIHGRSRKRLASGRFRMKEVITRGLPPMARGSSGAAGIPVPLPSAGGGEQTQ